MNSVRRLRAEREVARQVAHQLERQEAERQRAVRESIWSGFVAVFGHVEYDVMMSGALTRWREAYRRQVACEIPGCDTGSTKLQFDHCHLHGWIRGVLCGSHNTRLGHAESVMDLEGITIDLSQTCYGPHLANCPGCSGTRVIILPREMFRLERERITFPAQVMHPGGQVGHLPRSAERTWCGLLTAGMVTLERRHDHCCRCYTLINDAGGIPNPEPVRRGRLGQVAMF